MTHTARQIADDRTCNLYKNGRLTVGHTSKRDEEEGTCMLFYDKFGKYSTSITERPGNPSAGVGWSLIKQHTLLTKKNMWLALGFSQ